MTVSKEIARLDHSSLKVTVTIGKDDVRSQYDSLIADYTKTLQLPGFRKGKVPRNILIMKLGAALAEEALQKMIDQAVSDMLEDESFPAEDKPLPYSAPRLEGEKPKLDLESDLRFEVVYDVMPKINLGATQGLEIEIPSVSIREEDIQKELETVRERNAVVLDKEEGEASAKGDVVTVDYSELDEGGAVVPGTAREDFVFALGSGANVYKFDYEVTGMKKGETRDFDKTYPAEYPDKDMAGKTKKLRVTMKAVKARKLPELDDELAQDVDEKYQTLEDLKKSIRERLEKDLERRLRELKINALLEKIMETSPVDLPESMIALEIEGRWQNMAQQMGTSAGNLRKAMLRSKDGAARMEMMAAEWRPAVIKALHSRLVVETLLEREKTEVTDADMEAELEKIASDAGTDIEEVKKYYEPPAAREYFKDQIKERRLFDKLLGENTIKTGAPRNYEEIAGLN